MFTAQMKWNCSSLKRTPFKSELCVLGLESSHRNICKYQIHHPNITFIVKFKHLGGFKYLNAKYCSIKLFTPKYLSDIYFYPKMGRNFYSRHIHLSKNRLQKTFIRDINYYPKMGKCFYPRHLSFHPLSGSIRCPGVTLDLACHLDGRLQQRRFYTQIFVCDFLNLF